MSDQAAREAATEAIGDLAERDENEVTTLAEYANAAIDAYLAALNADGWRIVKVEDTADYHQYVTDEIGGE